MYLIYVNKNLQNIFLFLRPRSGFVRSSIFWMNPKIKLIFYFLGVGCSITVENYHRTRGRKCKEVNPFPCHKCTNRYKTISDMRKHAKACGDLPNVSCPYCSYKAHRKYNINKHIKSKHRGKALIRTWRNF